MANRNTDTVATIGKGTVAIPFQFTVDNTGTGGVVTAQYPSTSVVTVAKDGTTGSLYNLTLADKYPQIISCVASIMKGAAGSTLDAKIDTLSITDGSSTNVVKLQVRLSSTGAATPLTSAVVVGTIFARNSTVKT